MKWEESMAQPELNEVVKALEFAGNFEPLVVGPVTYYRRGKGGKYLYRVPNEDFRVETEKRKPHRKGKQARLPVRCIRNTKEKWKNMSDDELRKKIRAYKEAGVPIGEALKLILQKNWIDEFIVSDEKWKENIKHLITHFSLPL
jgi:hypothetical protein